MSSHFFDKERVSESRIFIGGESNLDSLLELLQLEVTIQ